MNVRAKTHLLWAALALTGLAAAPPARAQVGLFNFTADATGTTLTPFSDTSGGITATFSSPADPGGFVVFPTPFPGSLLLSGHILVDGPPFAAGSSTPLTISFDKNLSSLTLDFAVASAFLTTPQTFTLQAFENGASVGSLTVPGVKPAGSGNAEGVIGFFGPPLFNSVQLSTSTATAFAVDNIGVVAAPVPEASTTASFGLLLALGGLVIAAKKRKQTA